MRLGQVEYVDVIANAGSIGRGIIRSENLDVRPLPKNDLQDERNEMRFRHVTFADGSVGMRARCVEVAKGREAPLVVVGEIVERPFHGKLRLAVRIDGPLRRSHGGWSGSLLHLEIGQKIESKAKKEPRLDFKVET